MKAVIYARYSSVNAGTYYVWYKVEDTNYEAVAATPLTVKIAPATVSIIVNNASKTYDGSAAVNDDEKLTFEGGSKFSVTNAVAGFVSAFSAEA